MASSVANGLAAGSSVYTSTPGLNLSWWWNSPLYTLWRVAWGIASFLWIIVRTVVYAMLMLLQTAVTLILSYRFLFTWLFMLALTWILWMEFPALISIARSTWGLLNAGLVYLVFIANMWIRMYNIAVLIWNPFYPLLGFFIYVILDLTFSFLIEIVKILGSPAISQLVFLYMSYLHFWPQLFLSMLIPVLRYLPSVVTILVAEIGPIVEVIMSVTPVLFPMISWTFGKLFLTLEPILTWVVWAVKKVRKLFGRSQTMRQAFTSGVFIGRQLLQLLSPEQAATMTMATPFNVQDDIRFAAGDVTQVDEAMRLLMLGNATLSTAADRSTTTTTLIMPTTSFTDTPHGMAGTTDPGGGRKRSGFAVPDHAAPNYDEHLDSAHVADDESVWHEVGVSGMKAGWQNSLAVDAAKHELATIRGFMVEHPVESYDELAMRTNTYIASLQQVNGGAGISASSAESLATAESMDYSGKQGHSSFTTAAATAARSLFDYREVDNIGQWFVGDKDASGGMPLMSEDELHEAMEQFERVHTDARHSSTGEPSPPTAKHHLYVHKLMALGTPPHLLPHSRFDMVAIDRAHEALVNRTFHARPHRVRAAIERDVATGRTVMCQSRLCGGAGKPLPHPAHTMRQRHVRFKDTRTDEQHQYEEELDMERMKNRILMADTIQHATNAAAHRYAKHHAPHAPAIMEHHGSVILATVFGHESAMALLEHMATNYSSWAHYQHTLHDRFFANSELFERMAQHDPNAEERPFYKHYMREQRLHFVMERDERHGEFVPNIYVEQQEWVPPSQRAQRRDKHGRLVTVMHTTRSQAAGRSLLYTLPLFDFLSKLDCYTTRPRAPLCLPDIFPDNWQLSLSWLPLAFPFPDDINPRCFCAQFFCEQPRLYSKIFPGISHGNPVPDWRYFFGPCRYWNGIVVILLVLQDGVPLFFLSIAVLIARYHWLRPFLAWLFILPAGEAPSVRVFLCMFSHLYDLLLLIITVWVVGGIVVSRLWPLVDYVYVAVIVWMSTLRQREEDVKTRRQQTLEADLFNTAYDSSLNTGKRDYNDPGRNTRNSLGIPQRYYDAMVPGGRDPLYDTTQQYSDVERMQYYGVGSGKAPQFQPPYGNPAYRTRWEQAAEAPDLRRDNYGYYYRPGADEFDVATQPMYASMPASQQQQRPMHASLQGFIIGADTDDRPNDGSGMHYIGHGQPAEYVEISPVSMDGRDDSAAMAVATDAAAAAEEEAELLRDLQTIEALNKSLERNLLFFGQPWLPLHSPTYNVWHTLMGWLLDSHHFSEHWQRQMINLWRRDVHERTHYMPVRGPVLPERRRGRSTESSPPVVAPSSQQQHHQQQ